MAEDHVRPEPGIRVRAKRVPGCRAYDHVPALEREPEGGERGQLRGTVLTVQLPFGIVPFDLPRTTRRNGPQQRAGAAGRIEHGACRAGEVPHERGELGRGERVLPRVCVEMPPDQELVRLPRPHLGGELGDTAEEGDGGEEFGAGGGVYGGGGYWGGGDAAAVYGGLAVYAGRGGGGVNAG